MEDKRRSVKEIQAAQKIFEDAAEQMHIHAKNEEIEKTKELFRRESFINYKLAELCKWLLFKKSMFDLALEKLLTKEEKEDGKG